MGKNRIPIWPAEVVASIAHNDTYCGVMAGRKRDFAAVGLDIESTTPLERDLVVHVCRPAELELRTTIERNMSIDLPKLLFCVKESAFKAYSALTSMILDFDDITVHISPEDRSFVATICASAPPMPNIGRNIEGHLLKVAGLLIVWAAVPQIGS
jgi:4'-phosphopantetheinyl transferase EntD